eukprot:m.32424 g.32424  ORF g.32424 m.32424 type:complete len:98 (-) comp6383_c0_seq1:259-552(-)
MGTLGKVNHSFYDAYSQQLYENLVEIVWTHGTFSQPQDCGAVYCVQRKDQDGNQIFQPIAVHRLGDASSERSYGSNFTLAMDLLLPEGFVFVNPDFG